MSSGENEQPRATVKPSVAEASEGRPADKLEWQSELESAMSDVDSRLRHPRRRAGDVAAAQPMLPQLGQIDVTSELLDEIAWRVAEHMRRTQGGVAPVAPVAPAAPVAPIAPAALVIRLRKPLFSWRFWRRQRRRKAMINFSDYRVT